MQTIKTKLIRIGNSQGIRLSKSLIDQYNLKDEVILEPGLDSLTIRPIENPREGWEESFVKMHENEDDELLFPEPMIKNEWDGKEWEW